MYALVHKGRVLVGPMAWNRGLFEGALVRHNVSGHVPRLAPDSNNLPIIYDEETQIMPARYETPEHNTRIQRTYGPFWTFDDGIAVGTFAIKDQDLDMAKANFKNEAAAYRYELEVAGTTATVQDTEVTLSTKREDREVFAQRHALMGDSDTISWKFAEGWLTLSKTDVATLANAINTHVQTQFDWEVSKNTAIDAAADLTALDAIEIRPPEVEPELPEAPE